MANRFPFAVNLAWLRNVIVLGDGNDVRLELGQDNIGPVDHLWAWLRSFLAPEEETARVPRDDFSPVLRDYLMNDEYLNKCFNTVAQTAVLIGKAAVGKTTAMQAIMERLDKDRRNVTVVAMFFSCSQPEWHQPSKVMMRILAQFVKKYPRLIGRVEQLFEDAASEPDQCPPAKKTAAVLASILEDQRENDQSPACIIIDAVDECKHHVRETLTLLRDIQEKTSIGIIITDRLTQDGEWRKIFHAREIEVATAKEEDIMFYIKRRLMKAGLKPFEGKPGLLESVVKQLTDASGGNFLFARLYVAQLISNEATNEESLRKDLGVIQRSSNTDAKIVRSDKAGNTGKEHVYGMLASVAVQYLDRIAPPNNQTHDGQLASRVLRFVRDAERPLTVSELKVAIAWDTDSEAIDRGRFREWTEIQRICLGLVESDDPSSDSRVRFNHRTFKAVLEDDEMKRRLPDANEELGEICVQYLSQASLSSGACRDKANLEERVKAHWLLRYAAGNWKAHFDRRKFSPADVTTGSKRNSFHEAAERFLKSDSNVQCAVQLVPQNDPVFVGWSRALRNFAAMTFEEIHHMHMDRLDDETFRKVSYRFEETKNFGLLAAYRTTGLHLASWNGFETLVLRLLEAEKAFECRDRGDQTPLHVAAAAGHLEIVQLLLGHDADPDARDILGFSPLHAAAQRGSEPVVRMFLGPQREVDVNAQTTSRFSVPRQTALHIAIQEGHLGVVHILLNNSRINVDKQDARGETPLHLAARIGKYDIVKSVCNRKLRDGDPLQADFGTLRDLNGRNALHLACMNKVDPIIIQCLLGYCRSFAYMKDYEGKSPIHCAVEAEAVDIVKILMADPDVDVNESDSNGHTPVFKAIRTRNPQICNLFWDHGGIKWRIRAHGLDLIAYARRCGNEEIVERLVRMISPVSTRQTSAESSPEQRPASSPEASLLPQTPVYRDPDTISPIDPRPTPSTSAPKTGAPQRMKHDELRSTSSATTPKSRGKAPETPHSRLNMQAIPTPQDSARRPGNGRSETSKTATYLGERHDELISQSIPSSTLKGRTNSPTSKLFTPPSSGGKRTQAEGQPPSPQTPTPREVDSEPSARTNEVDEASSTTAQKQQVSKKLDTRQHKKPGQPATKKPVEAQKKIKR